MEGSAIAPPHQVAQVRWLIAAMLLGAAGSLVAISAFGSARYRVGPIVMEMKMEPSTSGTTELAVNVAGQLTPGFTEANTHIGFLTFRRHRDQRRRRDVAGRPPCSRPKTRIHSRRS